MGVEPENTLRSFVHAEQAGMDAVELDLHLSKDGALAVMHDAAVDRTTDGRGLIAEKTMAELRELDAGQGERVPVFEEVLDAVGSPVQAEIKDVAAARALAEVMLRRDLAGEGRGVLVPRRGRGRDRSAGPGGADRAHRQPLGVGRGRPGQGGRPRRRSP